MPTVKPRVNVTLNQSDYDLLREFCDLTGKSMSGYLSDVVSASAPQLRALVDVVGLARGLEGDALNIFRKELSLVGDDAAAALSEVSGSLKGVSQGSSPLSINKGVRLVNKLSNSRAGGKKLFLAAGNVFADRNKKGGVE